MVVVVAGTVGMVTKFVGVSGRIVELLDVPARTTAARAEGEATRHGEPGDDETRTHGPPAYGRTRRQPRHPVGRAPPRRTPGRSTIRGGARRRRDRRRQLGLAHQPARRRRRRTSGPRRWPTRSGSARDPCRRRRTRPGTLVMNSLVAGDVAALVVGRRRAGRATRPSPARRSPSPGTRWSAGSSRSVPSHLLELAVDHLHLVDLAAPRTLPLPSSTKRSVLTLYSALATLLVGRRDLAGQARTAATGWSSPGSRAAGA